MSYYTRCTVVLLLAFTLATAGVLPGGSPAEAQDPGPVFYVDPGDGWTAGGGWLPAAPITVTFGDPADPDHSETFESHEGGGLWHHVDYDIEVGEVVTVTDGVTTKSHTVVFVSVDVDQATHIATGQADPGTTVRVQLIEWGRGPETRYEEEVVADGDGAWTVDFAAAGVEVEDHHNVWAFVDDADGNGTRAHWRLYYPTLTVSLSDSYIVGIDLAARAPIEITIGDPVQFSDSTRTDLHGRFYLEVDFDIQGGQLVTVTDGITTLEHLTFPLAITHIDVETNVVSGVGEPGIGVAVYVAAEPWPVRGDEVAADGTWSVDFSEEGDVEDRGWTFDIQPGTHVEAAQWEGDFHTTNATTYSTTAGFPDVPEGHPFAVEIGWLVSEGVTAGFEDGTFRPTVAVSRQAAAAFLYRLAGEPPVSRQAGFSDVPVGHPFHDEIAWLVAEGITTGFEDGTFRPTSPVTRQAAAAFLFRQAGGLPVTGAAGFSDVPGDHRFHDEIAWLVAEGITTGFEDGTFRPTIPVTRQAMAAFLHRATTG